MRTSLERKSLLRPHFTIPASLRNSNCRPRPPQMTAGPYVQTPVHRAEAAMRRVCLPSACGGQIPQTCRVIQPRNSTQAHLFRAATAGHPLRTKRSSSTRRRQNSLTQQDFRPYPAGGRPPPAGRATAVEYFRRTGDEKAHFTGPHSATRPRRNSSIFVRPIQRSPRSFR